MEKIEVVTLEDKQEYGIMDTLEIEGIQYIYLQAIPFVENPEVVIRKLDEKNKIILGLDSREEYLHALEKYIEKSKENIDSSTKKNV